MNQPKRLQEVPFLPNTFGEIEKGSPEDKSEDIISPKHSIKSPYSGIDLTKDNFLFSLAPAYQIIGIDFDLISQFLIDNNLKGTETNYRSYKCHHDLFGNLEDDRDVLQSLSSQYFDLFNLWLNSIGFSYSDQYTKSYAYVNLKGIKVKDPLFPGDKYVPVLVGIPSCNNCTYQLHITKDHKHLYIKRV